MTTKQSLRFGMGCWLLAVLGASAADYTWLNAPASANWNEVDANWSGAASVWVSASTNNAIFGASGTTSVTAGSVTLNNLTFTADGYAILGGPLLMYGGPTVGSGLTASLGAAVTNVGVWTKSGAGTLVLNPGASGTNTLYSMKLTAGTVQVVSGTTQVTMPNSEPESGPAFWVEGGTLVVGGGLVRTTTNKFARVSGGGSLIVTNGLLDLTQNDELLNAHNTAGTTTVGGSGVLDVKAIRISQQYGAASLAVVNVNTGGLIKLNNFSLDASSKKFGTVNFNGGTCQAKTEGAEFFNTGNTNWSGIVAYVLEGGAIIDNNGKNIIIRQALLSGAANDGGFTKKGSGNLNLWGTNSYRGGTYLWAGSINVTNDAGLGAVPGTPSTNFTFVNNSTLMSSANHSLSANRIFRVPHPVTATFDTQSYTQTVAGVIAGEGLTNRLVKLGSGMLVIDPGMTSGFSVRSLNPQAGTLFIKSGSNQVTAASSGVQSQGFYIFGGTVLVGGGELKTTGGGYLTLQGGSLIITNGVVNLNSVSELLNAYSGTGTVTVYGSGVLDLQTLRISQSGPSVDSNVVNVNTGGVIRMQRFYIDEKNQSKGRVNFNGGTVVAKSTRGDFMGIAHTNWYSGIFFTVREGGAVIDSGAFDIDSKMPIYSGAASDGGFTKRGSGSFTFANTNMFNGVTSVEGGSLVLGVHNALPPTNAVVVFANALFNVNGKTQALARVGGSGTVTNLGLLSVTGVVAPGDAGSFGTLTLASPPAALAGTLSVSVSTNGACDRLHVNGNLNLASLSLSVENVSQLAKDKRYTLASCSGTLGAPFAAVGPLPPRWMVKYSAANKQAVLVYDFGTVILVR